MRYSHKIPGKLLGFDVAAYARVRKRSNLLPRDDVALEAFDPGKKSLHLVSLRNEVNRRVSSRSSFLPSLYRMWTAAAILSSNKDLPLLPCDSPM